VSRILAWLDAKPSRLIAVFAVLVLCVAGACWYMA
jgi:hypothetical protein